MSNTIQHVNVSKVITNENFSLQTGDKEYLWPIMQIEEGVIRPLPSALVDNTHLDWLLGPVVKRWIILFSG